MARTLKNLPAKHDTNTQSPTATIQEVIGETQTIGHSTASPSTNLKLLVLSLEVRYFVQSCHQCVAVVHANTFQPKQ